VTVSSFFVERGSSARVPVDMQSIESSNGGSKWEKHMVRSISTFVVAGLALVITGCANFNNYTKAIDLKKNSYALDVKQRVVFVQEVDTGYFGSDGKSAPRQVICAEPSPDALTVISASAGASVASDIAASAARSADTSKSSTSGNSTQAVNVSAALAEQGAFVGLRTQSIQLLRDTMYRLCEGYAGGAISPTEFTAMQRRYQSTMMGLLAIEQLTRPVVAAQVVLASSASTQSGASPGETAFDKAQDRVDQKVKDDVDAKIDLAAANTGINEAQKKLDKNAADAKTARVKAEKTETGDVAAKKAAGDEAVKSYDEARPGLVESLAKAKQAGDAAAMKADAAGQARKAAEGDMTVAKARVAASASGDGRIGAIREASAQMTADLTTGVQQIVSEINKSYIREACFSLISELTNRPDFNRVSGLSQLTDQQRIDQYTRDTERQRTKDSALTTCIDIIKADVEAQRALNKRADLETELRAQRSSVSK
jgi:hypothetical protein